MRGPGTGSKTERSQERPPRTNAKPQNSKNRAAANAPTTSPPPPTPMTIARDEARMRSSSDSGEAIIWEGEYLARAPDWQSRRPGILRRAIHWRDGHGHRCPLDRHPSRFPTNDYPDRETPRRSGNRRAAGPRSRSLLDERASDRGRG